MLFVLSLCLIAKEEVCDCSQKVDSPVWPCACKSREGRAGAAFQSGIKSKGASTVLCKKTNHPSESFCSQQRSYQFQKNLSWMGLDNCVGEDRREEVERTKEDLALQNASRSLWPRCPAKVSSCERKRWSSMQYLDLDVGSLVREKSGRTIAM